MFVDEDDTHSSRESLLRDVEFNHATNSFRESYGSSVASTGLGEIPGDDIANVDVAAVAAVHHDDIELESSYVTNSSDYFPISPLPLWRLILLTLAGLSSQLAWAIQIGYSTKTFLELGISESLVSFAWLAGPISGMITQPVVGFWSDRTATRIGRRKPYILAGLVCIILGLVSFSNSESMGIWFGDTSDDHSLGSVLAVLSFFLLDFSINALQGPVRTLISDVCPSEQQNRGNSMYAAMGSLGNLIGSGLGALSISSFLPFFGNDLRALYTVSGFIVVLCTVGCLVAVKEPPEAYKKQISPSSSVDDRSFSLSSLFKPVTSLAKAMALMPKCFYATWIVQCFCWFSWFSTFIFVASWVGFLYGEPSAEKGSSSRSGYDYGVRLGNLGLMFQAVVAILYAIVLPKALVSRIWKPLKPASSSSSKEAIDRDEEFVPTTTTTTKKKKKRKSRSVTGGGSIPLYFCAQMVLFGSLLSMWFVGPRQGWLAVLLIAATGITWANTLTVPWAIFARSISKLDDKGLYLSLFNLSQCWPEIAASISGNVVLSVWNNHAAPLVVSSLSALASAICVFLIRIPPE